MTILKNAVIAAGLLMISAGAAYANQAVAEQDLHMRAGPGPDYAAVTVMPQGANLGAWNCDGAWCRVSYDGRTGFASERYLDIARLQAAQPAYGAYAYAPEYRSYAYAEPAVMPNPLDFPLLPWNW